MLSGEADPTGRAIVILRRHLSRYLFMDSRGLELTAPGRLLNRIWAGLHRFLIVILLPVLDCPILVLLNAALSLSHSIIKYMDQSVHQISFVPFTPIIDIGFWTQLAKKKIEEYKLDEQPKSIVTKYKINSYKEKNSHLAFDVYSFSEPEYGHSGPYEQYVEAELQNFNMVEGYQRVDSLQFLSEQVQNIGDSPQIVKAYLVMFADLKKYLFRYRVFVPQIQILGLNITERKSLSEHLGEQIKPFFDTLKATINVGTYQGNLSTPYIFIDGTSFAQISLDEFKTSQNAVVLFFDAFNGDQINGTFQNLLAYLIKQNVTAASFIVFKDFLSYGGQKLELKNSLFLKIDLTKAHVETDGTKRVAFETNHYAKEKEIDLKGFMDEKLLARDAVDLNIKLMKWRMLPHIDLELIKNTKCLLFGAGTLGCQLARNLIGWGVRNITFVDYGKVSYSNPVRQTLFDYEDSINGGRPKAEVAAEKLKKIFPDIESKGYHIEIPMPGHYIGESQVERIVESLNICDQLVEQHDAVFLLTDSREARWLPTLLANKHKKMSFAVALGFDSFLIIRQGISVLSYDPQVHGERLSCYFCNDIAAPQDSMKDRTLDQQCTVTRPGLSFLAAAYSSELLVSLLQHPLREGAPASDRLEELQQTELGVLPHFLRGQLSDFEVKIFYGRSYDHCVACSKSILNAYLEDKEKFILRIMNDPEYLQEASGINATLKRSSEMQEIEIFDDFAVIN